MNGAMSDLVRMESVRFSYSGNAAFVLSVPGFFVSAGEIVGVFGPSGCGKSTLLKLALGRIDGRSRGRIWRADLPAGAVGYVPQQDWLLPWLTLRDNIEWAFRANPRLRRSSDYIQVMIRAAGLLDHLDSRVGVLSGGQRRRASLLRALSYQPALVFMDEPFSGLDLGSRNRLIDFISVVRGQRPFAVVLVSHEIQDLAILADRAYAIRLDGHVVSESVNLMCGKGSSNRFDSGVQGLVSAMLRLTGEGHGR